MPRICYVEKNFNAEHSAVIADADAICREFQLQGFTLSLRQLYYQFVARGLIENTPRKYKWLGDIINQARHAGLIDWEAIVDRGRSLETQPSWKNPRDILASCASHYHEDRWANQEWRPEVWIEKAALLGVIEPACKELDVPYYACRGYDSASSVWRAAMRLDRHAEAGYQPIVFHLGDHDPSGFDMTRDNQDRLSLFTRAIHVPLRRLALNHDQVDEFKPPPNPAKVTDTRAGKYIDAHGTESWELDALNPKVIDRIIREAIDGLIDHDRWAETEAREAEHLVSLKALSNRWAEVREFLSDDPEGSV